VPGGAKGLGRLVPAYINDVKILGITQNTKHNMDQVENDWKAAPGIVVDCAFLYREGAASFSFNYLSQNQATPAIVMCNSSTNTGGTGKSHNCKTTHILWYDGAVTQTWNNDIRANQSGGRFSHNDNAIARDGATWQNADAVRK
jgi:hypothetical protein